MKLQDNQILSESELIQGSLKKNPRIETILYKRFSPVMYNICRKYSKNPVDTEDMLQNGFINVFSNLDKYKGSGSFEGWMKRIFINVSISYFHNRAKRIYSPEPFDEILATESYLVKNDCSTAEILELVQQLSTGYRTIFKMYVIEGYSHKEIAEILGISEGTSKSQFARAKYKLQQLIKMN